MKNYCLKIDKAYNSYMTGKKSGLKSSAHDDKQIEEKFMELNKKVDDCQVSYYKEQIDGLVDE